MRPDCMMVQAYRESDMAFFAKGQLIAAAGALAFCLLTCVAQAASCGNSAAGFEQWKVEFAETAKAAGVKGKGLAALAGAQYAVGTIQADRSLNKAFSGSVDDFMRRRGGSAIISKGRSLKAANAADKIETRDVKVEDLLPPRVVLTVDDSMKPTYKLKVQAEASAKAG